MKAAPPFIPTRYGKRQIFPRPIADPARARITAALPPNFSLEAIHVRFTNCKDTNFQEIPRLRSPATAALPLRPASVRKIGYFTKVPPLRVIFPGRCIP